MAAWKSFSVCCALCGIAASQADAGFISKNESKTTPAPRIVVAMERFSEVDSTAALADDAQNVVSLASRQADTEISRQVNSLSQVTLNHVPDISSQPLRLSAADLALLPQIAPRQFALPSSFQAILGMAAFLIGAVGIAVRMVPELFDASGRRLQRVA